QEPVQAPTQTFEVTGFAQIGCQPERYRGAHAGPVHTLADKDARQLLPRRPTAQLTQHGSSVQPVQFTVDNQQPGQLTLARGKRGVTIMYFEDTQPRAQGRNQLAELVGTPGVAEGDQNE